MPASSILSFLNEDTKLILYHCAVCDLDIENKLSWYSHVNGRFHTVRTSPVNQQREVVKEVIGKINHLLGDQIEFILSIDEDTVKFYCNLCKVLLTSFFCVQDHMRNKSHEQRIMVKGRARAHSSRESSVLDEDSAPSVRDFTRYFTGSLKCIRCNEMVTFSIDELNTHVQNCGRDRNNVEASTSQPSVLDSSSEIDDLQTNFKRFLMSQRSNSNVEFLPTLQNAAISFTLPDVIKKSKITVKSFHCIYCNVYSTIETWETHVLKCAVTDGQNLFLHCSLCETLFYGDKFAVGKHIHFLENKNFFSLNYYPHLSKALTGVITKYFTFESSLLNSTDTDPKLKYYCVVCDVYGFHKIEKHFSSHRHKQNASLTCDLYFCNSCYVIIYGDAQLINYHSLSRNHILTKSQNKVKPILTFENVRHRFLLLSLKPVIERNLIENKIHDYVSYYCDLCFFVTSEKNDWNMHLESEDHKSSIENGEIKPYEYLCAYCKLTIFGTVFNHIMHTSSFGHENIKNFVIEYHNNKNVAAVKQTQISASVTHSDKKNVTGRNEKKGTPKNDEPSFKKPIQEIYAKKLDVRNPCDLAFNIREFVLDTLKETGLESCKSYHCWFCDFFSSERSWWNHLQSQPHIDRLSQYYQSSKTYKAVTLFCYTCNLLILGATFLENQHVKKAEHLKKAKKSLMNTHRGDEEKKAKRSEPSLSNDVDKTRPENIPGPSGVTCNGTTVNSHFPEVFGTNEEFQQDLKLSQNAPAPTLFRSTSVSSNASSTQCDNDDKSEDEGDELYNVLLNGESDAEDKVSDHELDDSFINEMKEDLPSPVPSTSQASDVRKNEPIENKPAEVANNDNIEIVKHLIIAKGIPPQIINNKRICFATFSRYGVIRRIFTKKSRPDWLYLMVLTEPEEVFNRLNNNVKTLKTKLGTDELSFEYDTRNTDNTGIRKQLASEVEEIFSHENAFNQAVNELLARYELESNSEESRYKIKILEGTILNLAQTIYGNTMPVKVFTFGSRVTGLATENSDVDIYLQINHSFGGGFHDNTPLQQQLVLLFSNKMKQGNSEFKNVISIPFARVPIVKFTHTRSKLNCDLSFKSGLSTMNSMLVKTYLELDSRIKFLVCAVKIWMKKNDLADRNLFTTYAQIWMVLFYLMQVDVAIVPTVIALRHTLPPMQQSVDVEGWNCAFPNIKNIIWRSKSTLTNKELLLGFFQFYSKDNLQDYVLCTLTGLRIPKKYFLESYENLPPTFNQYKFKIKNDRPLYWKICDDYDGLCVQDPFDHCHNLTKTINIKKLGAFVNLCQQTVEKIKLMDQANQA